MRRRLPYTGRSSVGACALHGGVEVDIQGDAFFVAFATAPAALAAAAELTEALTSGPVLVRAGLLVGTPLLSDEGYVSVDVHRVFWRRAGNTLG